MSNHSHAYPSEMLTTTSYLESHSCASTCFGILSLSKAKIEALDMLWSTRLMLASSAK
jgi:hypothetical protein